MALTRRLWAVAVGAAVLAPAAWAQEPPRPAADTIPAGFGSLRRDEVAVSVQVQGLTIRAIPLDEQVLRTLAPDTYRSLHALVASRGPALNGIRSRTGLAAVQAWHVAFFNAQQGEARYDPRGMQLRSAGRDFRPLDVIALVAGYDDGRLAQGRTADAIFVFDPAVQLGQPITVTLAGLATDAWTDVIPRLERERSTVWSRATAARKP
jgi:hypothetical protein